jgi:hypothetical protein
MISSKPILNPNILSATGTQNKSARIEIHLRLISQANLSLSEATV